MGASIEKHPNIVVMQIIGYPILVARDKMSWAAEVLSVEVSLPYVFMGSFRDFSGLFLIEWTDILELLYCLLQTVPLDDGHHNGHRTA